MHLVGHADPRGDADYNYLLGQRRADSVKGAVVRTPGSPVRSFVFEVPRILDDSQSYARRNPCLRTRIRIVREIGNQGPTGILLFLATLCAYLSPMLAGVVLFELVTGAVFHATYPEAASEPQRGFRLARLHQAILLATLSSLVAIPLFVLAQSVVPAAVLLVVWVMPALVSASPLIAIAGREVWLRPLVLIALLGALFVPCVVLVVSLALLRSLRRALENEGFRFGWVRSEPRAPREASTG
jgi:hypothetical protein